MSGINRSGRKINGRNSHRSKKRVLSGVASLALLLWGQNALSAGSADVMMEEVLVYGTKKSSAEAVQDIPGQITAFGTAQLEARQVLNIEDLSFATPNVQLASIGTQVSFASFAIRGLGIDSSTPSIDPNVGVFVDGVYAGIAFGVVTDTFDLESVEIYKGPQGLLFGRNVTGGAVLLRSRRPTGEFGLKMKAGVEDNQSTVGLSVEGALIENVLAGKVSLQYKDDDGWHDNEFLNEDTGDQTSEFFRGTLVYTPNDTMDFTFILEDGKTEGEQVPVQNAFIPGGPAISFDNPITPDNSSFNVSHDFKGLSEVEWTQFTFETGVDLGSGRLTNIMAYREVESLSFTDLDGISVADGGRTQLAGIYKVEQHQFSNEIRYNLQATENWQLTTGLVYFVQEYAYQTGLFRGAPLVDSGNEALGGGTQDQDSWSFYFNNEYAITDTFSINGGFNYLVENKEVRILPRHTVSLENGDCNIESLTCIWSRGLKADDDWSNFSPKIGFTWQVLEDASIYGHVARAYRSGFFNIRQPNPAAINLNPTDVEEHNSIEFGIKSNLFDNRVRLNAAIFHQDIDDLARSARSVIVTSNGEATPVADLINVGDARISGVEVDLTARISENLVITAALGYLDGDLTEVNFNLNNSNQKDANGNDVIGSNGRPVKAVEPDSEDQALALVRLSQWTANLGVNYDLYLGNLGLLSLRADYAYRAEAAARDDNAGFFPKTNMANAGVTYSPNDANWTLSLYGKNLNDQVVFKSIGVLGAQTFLPIGKGRRYGLEFRYAM
ncbi:MAG: TonB-dependent receptor [Pseudomonadales bacterium]|nr:TonB-dependent receptor [Pseudomonadales bacterium]